jgi:hypothetical protein
MCGFQFSKVGLAVHATFGFACLCFLLLYQMLVLGSIKVTEEKGTLCCVNKNNFKVS